MLKHHAARAPSLIITGQNGFPKGQRKPRRDLFGLGEIGLGTGRQGPTRNGRDPLIGRHALALIDHDAEKAATDLRKRVYVGLNAGFVKACIGADTGGLAVLGRAIIIRRDQTRRPIPADLQRQFPAQLDRLSDQRGQQRSLSHQRLNHGRIVVLFQNIVQHPVQTGHAPTNVAVVKLERQDRIVPSDFRTKCHGVSLQACAWHTVSI